MEPLGLIAWSAIVTSAALFGIGYYDEKYHLPVPLMASLCISLAFTFACWIIWCLHNHPVNTEKSGPNANTHQKASVHTKDHINDTFSLDLDLPNLEFNIASFFECIKLDLMKKFALVLNFFRVGWCFFLTSPKFCVCLVILLFKMSLCRGYRIFIFFLCLLVSVFKICLAVIKSVLGCLVNLFGYIKVGLLRLRLCCGKLFALTADWIRSLPDLCDQCKNKASGPKTSRNSDCDKLSGSNGERSTRASPEAEDILVPVLLLLVIIVVAIYFLRPEWINATKDSLASAWITVKSKLSF